MTRQALLSSILAAPLAAFAAVGDSKAKTGVQGDVAFGPGTIRIGQGGGIRITGASGVHIEGCAFEGSTVVLS